MTDEEIIRNQIAIAKKEWRKYINGPLLGKTPPLEVSTQASYLAQRNSQYQQQRIRWRKIEEQNQEQEEGTEK
jgi:hypothetical protein